MGFRLANRGGQAVLIDGEEYWNLGMDPMAALLHQGMLRDRYARRAAPDGVALPAELGPPVPAPQKVFGYGLNYLDHVEEMGHGTTEAPVVFTKFPSCITGPASDVVLVGDRCDYEGELVVVIGAEARSVPEGRVWDRIAGLMIGQDISDRRLQTEATPPQFSLGKSRDSFGPTGPAVVSADLLVDRNDLAIQCRVNGELRQDSRTSLLIRPVAQMVSYLSEILTLLPGDLIFTGTPAGVGHAQGLYLEPGDVIISTIEGLGSLHNTCR